MGKYFVTINSEATPENSLSSHDPGDDTQRRFRYQSAYTAILWLGLLDDDSEYEYLYCEHHEDILLKRKCGDYCGVQVKTQSEGYEPFRATDEPIVSSIQRFINADIEFAGQFFPIRDRSELWFLEGAQRSF